MRSWHQVHEVSDWVFTLDRNLGIEFFDHGGLAARPDYLIDHSTGMANALGHRLVITSRSVAELEALLRPVLEQYGLSADGGHAVVLLGQLRSLSGRLALKLISSPTRRAEALGLALSRLYLEHQGVFAVRARTVSTEFRGPPKSPHREMRSKPAIMSSRVLGANSQD